VLKLLFEFFSLLSKKSFFTELFFLKKNSMPNGRKGYWSAGPEHLASKALSLIGANVVTHYIVGFNWLRFPKRSEFWSHLPRPQNISELNQTLSNA